MISAGVKTLSSPEKTCEDSLNGWMMVSEDHIVISAQILQSSFMSLSISTHSTLGELSLWAITLFLKSIANDLSFVKCPCIFSSIISASPSSHRPLCFTYSETFGQSLRSVLSRGSLLTSLPSMQKKGYVPPRSHWA